jgi:hypothetical protein
MLLRLAYLGVSNAFALLRLLPSDRDKDTQILALHHQLAVLQRQLGPRRVSLHPSDRALLAAEGAGNVVRAGRGWFGSPCATRGVATIVGVSVPGLQQDDRSCWCAWPTSP